MKEQETVVDPGSTVERRRGLDRRSPPHWSSTRWIFGGRRRQVRRAGQVGVNRIDFYPASLLAAVVLILGLSSLDAAFTLHLLEHGVATEANPLMASLLDTNVQRFVALKTALTASCIIMLVLYSQTRFMGRIPIGHSLYAIAGLYSLLIGYELILFAQT